MRSVAPSLLVLVLGACSVITDPDPNELGGIDPPPAGDASGTDASGPPPPPPPPGDGSVPPPELDATTPPTRDASVPPEEDASVRVEDAGHPVDPEIDNVPCGSMTCSVAGTLRCCDVQGGEGTCYDPDATECRCEGLFCDSASISCNGPEDCPGAQVCCAFRGFADDYVNRIACVDECRGNTLSSAALVCRPGDPGAACPPGEDCVERRYLPDGYFVCND